MEASIRYIARTPNLTTEKAFSTDFSVDHIEGARRENTKPDHHRMTLSAIEDRNKWKLDTHGFCFLRGSTHLDPEKVYVDKAAIQDSYWHELEAILHKNFPQYSRIECFDFTARKRDLNFPQVVQRYNEEYEQPSTVAHCDWSRYGALKVLHCVWRPLKEPSDDWPLAICDYTTIDQDNDILLSDAIRRDRVDEICVLHFNADHQWYYLKDQGVDDLLVFRNADSHGEKPRAFHAAVRNPLSQGPPRESVEVRMVAIY
ncbi:putative CmcJ-like methyltransferase [Annulohypoxylon nitens]|nr:putative CmcJ-like methyltransferase [Annulohypoxylon nitens]